jgi:hypothetical protein
MKRSIEQLQARNSWNWIPITLPTRNDMPNGGYVAENGISLCASCHLLAEIFHDTGTAYPGFSPDELYAKIDSSLEKAQRASLKL